MVARLIMGALSVLISAVPVFSARTILYYENECCRNITEGEFAILYCQGLKLREPAQGWTVQTAAAALTSLGHQPAGGWVLSRFLSEAVMARLLRNSPYFRKPLSDNDFQRSNRLVTIARARNVVDCDEAITQGEFAILLAQALKVPIPEDCGPDAAIRTLTSLKKPLKPLAGWKADRAMRETEMVEILAPTSYQPTMIDPKMEITPLHAYSLLFGKYEIATQGLFGLFVVQALGLPAPPEGWNKRNALAAVSQEFGIEEGYGLNPNVPLCTEFFVNSLRMILTKVEQSSQTPPGMPSSTGYGSQAMTSGGSSTGAASTVASPIAAPRTQPAEAIEAFIGEARRTGMLASDVCQIMPARGLRHMLLYGGGPLPGGTAVPITRPPTSSETPPPDQQ